MIYQLAEVNIARMLAPLDSPLLAEFVAQLTQLMLSPTTALAFSGACKRWKETPRPCVPTRTISFL